MRKEIVKIYFDIKEFLDDFTNTKFIGVIQVKTF